MDYVEDDAPAPGNRRLCLGADKKQQRLILAIAFAILFFCLGLIIYMIVNHGYAPSKIADEVSTKPTQTSFEPKTPKTNPMDIPQPNSDSDPCEDFAKFNARFGVAHFDRWGEPAGAHLAQVYEEPTHDEDHPVVQTAKKLFQACVKFAEDDEFNLLTPLLKLGSWPMFEAADWEDVEFNWVDATLKFRELGVSHEVFFGVSVDVNPLNRTQYVLNVTMSPSRLIEENVMRDVANILGVNESRSTPEIDDAYSFMKLLSEHDTAKSHAMVTIAEFQRTMQEHLKNNTTRINWLDFINNLVSSAAHLNENDLVVFPLVDQVITRLTILWETSKRSQANYMMWKAIEDMAPNLIWGLELKHRPSYSSRQTWKGRCMDIVQKRFLPNPFDIIYVKRYFPVTKMAKLNELAKYVKEELAGVVRKTDWLEVDDRENMATAINDTVLIMGAPYNFYQSGLFDDLGADLELTTSDDFVELNLGFSKAYQTYWYKQVKNPVVQWKVHLMDFLPKHNFEDNTLEIPAAALQNDVFDETSPASSNYGFLGTFVASSHLFDLLTGGRESLNDDHDYKLISNKSKITLESKLNCFLKQAMNGSTIFNFGFSEKYELLRRSMGTKASYLAYERYVKANGYNVRVDANFSTNQLFWMAAMRFDREVIGEGPVNLGTLVAGTKNLDFGKDFNCPPGSKMNPINKCGMF